MTTTYANIVNSSTFNPGLYGVRATIQLLRETFKINPDFGFKIYEDDLMRSDAYGSLLITSKNDWETKYRHKRPIIIISHGNIVNGINGTQGQGKFLGSSVDGSTISYSDLISYPIMVECLSESDTESGALTSIANIFLTSDVKILHSLGLQLLGNPVQSAPQLFEKGNISFISSLIINVQANRKYTAKLINDNILKEIKVKLNSALTMDIKNEE